MSTTQDRLAVLKYLKAASGGKEAVYRASNTPRFLRCPGSIQLSAGVPRQKASKYAMEGTAAHHVAAEALQGIRQPEEWVGRKVQVEDTGWFVDDEMRINVQFYVDYVRSIQSNGNVTHVEHYMSLTNLDPSDPMIAENRGTGDYLQLDYTSGHVDIVDLKYGRGVMVKGDSPQLKNYALMAMYQFPRSGGWNSIKLHVVQPRAFNEELQIKTVAFDPATLDFEFTGQLLDAMERALDPDPPLVPDPDPDSNYCRWCPAGQNAKCPALAARAASVGQKAFASVPMITALTPIASAPKTYVLPDLSDATPDELSLWLDSEAAIGSWFAGVKQRATKLMEMGTNIKHYGLKPRTGNRTWIEQVEPTLGDTLKQKFGLDPKAVYAEPKLRTPAQIEKLLPKKRHAELAVLVKREQKGYELVRDVEGRYPPHLATSPVFTPLPSETT